MNFRTRTVGDIVAEDYRRAGVFKQFGIDFCCGGNRTLAEACATKDADVDEVERALATANGTDGNAARMQPDSWTLDFLANYIENIHHSYVRQNLPVLLEFSRKVARVHGHQDPWVVEVEEHVQELAAEMTDHMRKEEEVLFPYVAKIVEAAKSGTDAGSSGFGSVTEPIEIMEDEHEHTGALLAAMRRLTNDFVPPAHACNTYRALYAKLEEFEEDLHRHVHLENNILFPKTAALEATLRRQGDGASA